MTYFLESSIIETTKSVTRAKAFNHHFVTLLKGFVNYAFNFLSTVFARLKLQPNGFHFNKSNISVVIDECANVCFARAFWTDEHVEGFVHRNHHLLKNALAG
jgi:hypothetical protein